MKKNIVALFAVWIFAESLYACNSKADTFYFDTSNVFGNWTGLASTGYGEIEITETLSGLNFVVSANSAFFTTSGPGLTWDTFLFNIAGSPNVSINDILISEPGTWNITYHQNRSDFGTFEFDLAGHAIGSNAINPLVFFINLSGLTISDVTINNNKDFIFAAHLRRFVDPNDSSITSTWLGVDPPPPPQVPEPATMLLFGTGLAGLAAVSRKKTG